MIEVREGWSREGGLEIERLMRKEGRRREKRGEEEGSYPGWEKVTVAVYRVLKLLAKGLYIDGRNDREFEGKSQQTYTRTSKLCHRITPP